MRLIDADALIECLKESYNDILIWNDDDDWSRGIKEGIYIAIGILNAQPIQPEIIRCKDCVKREFCRTSTIWATAPGDNWYCADAERRTE